MLEFCFINSQFHLLFFNKAVSVGFQLYMSHEWKNHAEV